MAMKIDEKPILGEVPSAFLTVRLVEDGNYGGGPRGHFEVEIYGDHFSAGDWAVIGGTPTEMSKHKAEAVMGGFQEALLVIAERALKKRREMKMKEIGLTPVSEKMTGSTKEIRS